MATFLQAFDDYKIYLSDYRYASKTRAIQIRIDNVTVKKITLVDNTQSAIDEATSKAVEWILSR